MHAFCFASVSQGASIAMQLTCELKLLRLKPTDQMTKPISPSEIFRSCYNSRLTRWTGWNSLSFADHNASTGQMARAGKGKGENQQEGPSAPLPQGKKSTCRAPCLRSFSLQPRPRFFSSRFDSSLLAHDSQTLCEFSFLLRYVVEALFVGSYASKLASTRLKARLHWDLSLASLLTVMMIKFPC